jgi:hypothetical protein
VSFTRSVRGVSFTAAASFVAPVLVSSSSTTFVSSSSFTFPTV